MTNTISRIVTPEHADPPGYAMPCGCRIVPPSESADGAQMLVAACSEGCETAALLRAERERQLRASRGGDARDVGHGGHVNMNLNDPVLNPAAVSVGEQWFFMGSGPWSVEAMSLGRNLAPRRPEDMGAPVICARLAKSHGPGRSPSLMYPDVRDMADPSRFVRVAEAS